MQPKISVIIPVYNVEKYLKKCLDSVLAQTLDGLEIICVDDGSTDSSFEIMREYTKKDKRIKLLQKENGGLSSARNFGLKASSAEYISFIDSDDYVHPSMLEKMYDALVQNDVDLAVCSANVIYESSTETKASDDAYLAPKFLGKNEIDSAILHSLNVFAWNKLFKKSIIDEFKISFPEGLLYEDACFYFQYMSVAKTIFCLEDKFYYYIRRENSIMSDTFGKKGAKALDHLKICDVIYDFLVENNLYIQYRKDFLTFYISYFWMAHKHLPNDKKALALEYASDFLIKNDVSLEDFPKKSGSYRLLNNLKKRRFNKIIPNKVQKLWRLICDFFS